MFLILNAELFTYLGLGLLVIVVLIVSLHVKFVPQAHQYVVERFQAYRATWDTGMHILTPFIDRVAKKVSLKEQVVDFDPQPVITKDNVTMQIDTVVFFQVTDAKLLAYGVEQPIKAIENLTATTLRNIIGELELDQTLTSRDTINVKMRSILDEATDPWGIKVNRVEVKNILPPRDIREAMEKQMRAERERRESILKAEGDKRSAILRAEGEKESAIMAAEGKAEAILITQKAKAEGIRLINDSKVSNEYIALEQIKAYQAIAASDATRLIVPSDMQGFVSGASVMADIFNKGKK